MKVYLTSDYKPICESIPGLELRPGDEPMKIVAVGTKKQLMKKYGGDILRFGHSKDALLVMVETDNVPEFLKSERKYLVIDFKNSRKEEILHDYSPEELDKFMGEINLYYQGSQVVGLGLDEGKEDEIIVSKIGGKYLINVKPKPPKREKPPGALISSKGLGEDKNERYIEKLKKYVESQPNVKKEATNRKPRKGEPIPLLRPDMAYPWSGKKSSEPKETHDVIPEETDDIEEFDDAVFVAYGEHDVFLDFSLKYDGIDYPVFLSRGPIEDLKEIGELEKDGNIEDYIPKLTENLKIASRAAQKLKQIPQSEDGEDVYFLDGLKYYVHQGEITAITKAGKKTNT